jgi:hypothetical protein
VVFRRAPPLTLHPLCPRKPIVVVRRSGTGLPHRTSLHAICKAVLVTFFDFSAAFDLDGYLYLWRSSWQATIWQKSLRSLAKYFADSCGLNICSSSPYSSDAKAESHDHGTQTASLAQRSKASAVSLQATIPDSTPSLPADWRGRPGTGNLTLQVPNHTARSTRRTRGRELVDSSHLPR